MYTSSSLDKFIHQYFIVFYASVNWIVSFFSGTSLLVYRNTTKFCVLIIYPSVLLNLLVSSNSSLVES